MAANPSILAWRIPWTEEPGRLQSTGLQESDNLVTKNQQQALNFIHQEFRQSTADMAHSCSIKTGASVRVAQMAEDR